MNLPAAPVLTLDAHHVPVNLRTVPVVGLAFVGLARRKMERTCDLFIEQNVAHWLANPRMKSQRELADKAEASRFTELRSYLEAQALTEQQRETALGTVMADRFAQQQQVLLARMEQMDNTLAAYMGELEQRLGQRASTINLPHDNTTTFG